MFRVLAILHDYCCKMAYVSIRKDGKVLLKQCVKPSRWQEQWPWWQSQNLLMMSCRCHGDIRGFCGAQWQSPSSQRKRFHLKHCWWMSNRNDVCFQQAPKTSHILTRFIACKWCVRRGSPPTSCKWRHFVSQNYCSVWPFLQGLMVVHGAIIAMVTVTLPVNGTSWPLFWGPFTSLFSVLGLILSVLFALSFHLYSITEVRLRLCITQPLQTGPCELWMLSTFLLTNARSRVFSDNNMESMGCHHFALNLTPLCPVTKGLINSVRGWTRRYSGLCIMNGGLCCANAEKKNEVGEKKGWDQVLSF